MKKSLLFVLLLITSVVFISCDSKKDEGSGNKVPANTPIVEGDFTSYIGNYTVTSIHANGTVDTGATYSTDNTKEILDFAGLMVVSTAGADNIKFDGSIQLGGNSFIKAGLGDSAIFKVAAFNVNPATSDVFVDVDAQTLAFTGVAFDGYEYNIHMKKNNNATNIDTKTALWKQDGLCFEDANNDDYSNCTVSFVATSGMTEFLEGHTGKKSDVSYVLNPVSNALLLIADYYIDTIEIVDAGTTTCTNGAKFTNATNGLVGELAAKAGLGGMNNVGKLLVNLDIALKFQFETPIVGCNFIGDGYNYEVLSDKIPVDSDPTKIDFGKIFTDEGLIIVGTQTITYEPKKRNPTTDVLEDTTIGGAKVKITLKKSRTGVLGHGYAKDLVNTKYY